jgi:hypothetical protein
MVHVKTQCGVVAVIENLPHGHLDKLDVAYNRRSIRGVTEGKLFVESLDAFHRVSVRLSSLLSIGNYVGRTLGMENIPANYVERGGEGLAWYARPFGSFQAPMRRLRATDGW